MGEISDGTSYQIVRWVFRRFTQITTPICTSRRLRTSSEISFTFIHSKRRSPSFGSQKHVFNCHPKNINDTGNAHFTALSTTISLCVNIGFTHQNTWHISTLLVPCFKTGSEKWVLKKWLLDGLYSHIKLSWRFKPNSRYYFFIITHQITILRCKKSGTCPNTSSTFHTLHLSSLSNFMLF